MNVALTAKQRDVLLRLVDEEIAELGLEIHHTRTYKDPLKEQKHELCALRDLLAETGPGDRGATVQPASSEPLGMA